LRGFLNPFFYILKGKEENEKSVAQTGGASLTSSEIMGYARKGENHA